VDYLEGRAAGTVERILDASLAPRPTFA